MAKRRKQGTGTIRQRKDGRWEGRAVIGYDERGLPKTKSVLAKTKRSVRKAENAVGDRERSQSGEDPPRHGLWRVAGLLVSELVQAQTPSHHPGLLRG